MLKLTRSVIFGARTPMNCLTVIFKPNTVAYNEEMIIKCLQVMFDSRRPNASYDPTGIIYREALADSDQQVTFDSADRTLFHIQQAKTICLKIPKLFGEDEVTLEFEETLAHMEIPAALPPKVRPKPTNESS